MTAKRMIAIAAFSMALAVALGAFGAHGLKEILSEKSLETWHTASFYHVVHSLGLLSIGLTQLHSSGVRFAPLAYKLMLVGILIFSGSLYTLSISGIGILGAITPIGGIALIASWILFGISSLRSE